MLDFYAGRHFPRATMRILQTLRDGRPLHYLTIARTMGERPNLCAARLAYTTRIGYVAKCPDLGRGFYTITCRGMDRLTFLEAHDPGR